MARAAGQHRPEANIRSWELDLAPRGRRQADRMTDGLLVGELAAKSGVERKALRLCEARRIVPTPGRTPAGYRLYPPDTVHLLALRRACAPARSNTLGGCAYRRAPTRWVPAVRPRPRAAEAEGIRPGGHAARASGHPAVLARRRWPCCHRLSIYRSERW